MSISTNLSVTGQWLRYNGQINNIGLPTLQICCTDQIFFQSSTRRPFYASRRRDSWAGGIHTILSLCFKYQYDIEINQLPLQRDLPLLMEPYISLVVAEVITPQGAKA